MSHQTGYNAALKQELVEKRSWLNHAVAENFFSKLKRECVYRTVYKTREQARQDIFIYLEIFYNRKRRHADIGYVSPEQFEQEYYRKQKIAA